MYCQTPNTKKKTAPKCSNFFFIIGSASNLLIQKKIIWNTHCGDTTTTAIIEYNVDVHTNAQMHRELCIALRVIYVCGSCFDVTPQSIAQSIDRTTLIQHITAYIHMYFDLSTIASLIDCLFLFPYGFLQFSICHKNSKRRRHQKGIKKKETKCRDHQHNELIFRCTRE